MFSPQIRGFFYGTLATASLISVITFASGPDDGVFGIYFQNIIDDAGCGIDSAVTGFDTAPVNYGKQKCTTFQNIVRTVLGVGGSTTGQAVIGFKADGSPLYGDVNWHKDGAENISYTGAGNVGIGTNTPNSKLDVQSGSISSSLDNTWNLHVTNTYTNTAQQHSAFIGLRARGDHTTPSYPQLGDTLASIIGRDAIDGLTTPSAYGGAGIAMAATENFDATHKGTNITFHTTDNGAMLPTDKMIIDHNGRVGIGIAIPTEKLEVNGNIVANTPTASNHVATKGYVDANGGGLGYAQTWQYMGASRLLDVTYTNATSKPISVKVTGTVTSNISQGHLLAYVGGVLLGATPVSDANSGGGWLASYNTTTFIVPPGSTYSVTKNLPNISLLNWVELR